MEFSEITLELDKVTIQRLSEISGMLGKSRSEILSEAIQRYCDNLRPRPQSEVEAELRELRLARRSDGRRTRIE